MNVKTVGSPTNSFSPNFFLPSAGQLYVSRNSGMTLLCLGRKDVARYLMLGDDGGLTYVYAIPKKHWKVCPI